MKLHTELGRLCLYILTLWWYRNIKQKRSLMCNTQSYFSIISNKIYSQTNYKWKLTSNNNSHTWSRFANVDRQANKLRQFNTWGIYPRQLLNSVYHLIAWRSLLLAKASCVQISTRILQKYIYKLSAIHFFKFGLALLSWQQLKVFPSGIENFFSFRSAASKCLQNTKNSEKV